MSDCQPHRPDKLQPHHGDLLQVLYREEEVHSLGHVRGGQQGPCSPKHGKSSVLASLSALLQNNFRYCSLLVCINADLLCTEKISPCLKRSVEFKTMALQSSAPCKSKLIKQCLLYSKE